MTSAAVTLQADIIVSTLRPDIVVVNKVKKTMHVFELTCPGEPQIEIAHKLKSEKYAHLATDIKTHQVSIMPFEIGSHTGHITRDNCKTLLSMHKFCTKNIKFKIFKKNISAISVLCSYFLFNCRNEKNWEGCSYIVPPFSNH